MRSAAVTATVLLALAASGRAWAANAPAALAGSWRLGSGATVVLAANGDAREAGRRGSWQRDGRTYVIMWFNPEPGMENEIDEVDRVSLSADGKTLQGNQEDGTRISGVRLAHAVTLPVPAARAGGSGVAYAPARTTATGVTPAALSRRANAGQLRATASLPVAAAAATVTAGPAIAATSATAPVPSSASQAVVQAPASSYQAGAQASVLSATALAPAMPGAPTVAAPPVATNVVTAPSLNAGVPAHTSQGVDVHLPVPAGAPIVSPQIIGFSAPNQHQDLAISLPGWDLYMTFCPAPGNCASGGSTIPVSCANQYTLSTSWIQGPNATVTVYGPRIAHVTLDCTIYVEPDYTPPVKGYLATPITIHIRT
jgi:hypothetical protein